MNYTKFHWGDWNTAVRFLPVEQEGFYMRLLSVYYTTERPIPVEMSSACENVGAFTPEHCAAVEAVLRRFFTLQPDGWHQKRCDEEIAAAAESTEEANARRENEKERQRRHREYRKDLYEQLRALGHVPKWDTPTRELVDTLERLLANPPVGPVTPPVTRDRPLPVTPRHAPATAIATSHKPLPNNQDENLGGGDPPPPETRTRGNGAAAAASPSPAAQGGPDGGDAVAVLERPEVAVDSTPLTAAGVADALKAHGRMVVSALNQHVVEMAEMVPAAGQLLEAIAAARRHRADEASTQPINAGLVKAKLASVMARDSPPRAGKLNGRALAGGRHHDIAAQNFREGVLPDGRF